MISITGLSAVLLVCFALYVLGILFWFYPLLSAVYGYKLYVLMNFINRDEAIRTVEDMLGVPLRDDPENGYRQYFDVHPEFVLRSKIVAVWFWFVATFFVCFILYAAIKGKLRVF